MSISSVTPTLTGAPETLLRRPASDVRANQLTVDTSQLVDPRQAVDGRPQTIQTAEPSDRAVKRKQREDQQSDEAEEAEEQGGLTETEQREVAELKQRDQEVRAHEHAHLAAAGPYAQSGARYDLELGPDGNSYATGGEVQIDTAPISDDPAATIAKMQTVRGAALAPRDPSAADQQVAAEATQEISKAQRDLSVERQEDRPGPNAPVSATARAGSAYARSEALPDDPRRSLFDFTV